MNRIMAILLLISALFIQVGSQAASRSWNRFIQELREDAIADGIRPEVFDQALAGVKPNKRVISFDRRQPEKRLTFKKYRRTRASKYRITLGKREFRKHQQLLSQVERRYHVDPCFIIAVWGMESSYGRYMGNFPVIKSLATLAFDDRRSEFFRKELLLALHIIQDGHVDPDNFKGEWAGGSGHPQFLPSSWHRYAVDFDQDGRKDIWSDIADVFGSIANYYSANGWQRNQPWAAQVDLPKGFDEKLIGYKTDKTIGEWKKMGVKIKTHHKIPADDEQAWVIQPYGGPTIMAFKNFRVIMRYNNSTFYAGTIGYMADAICSRQQSV